MAILLNRPTPVKPAAAPMRRVLFFAVAALALCLTALSFLFYTLPFHYDSFFFGLNAPGMHQFQRHFGLDGIHSWPFRTFSRVFRVLVVLLWVSYAGIVAACLRGAKLAARPLAGLIALVAVAVAVFMPPLLSTDCYANASHGRLFVLYSQNPYLFGPEALSHAHDPAAHFLTWDAPTIYGPLWTWLEIGIVALLRHGSVWTQVIALKLLEAGALVAAALAGRRLAARLAPGRETVTLAAIGLNPMLLLEGPGSGHNDLVCLAFLLLGGALFYDKKVCACRVVPGFVGCRQAGDAGPAALGAAGIQPGALPAADAAGAACRLCAGFAAAGFAVCAVLGRTGNDGIRAASDKLRAEYGVSGARRGGCMAG